MASTLYRLLDRAHCAHHLDKAILICVVLTCALCTYATPAWGEDLDTDPAPDEFQQEVERTAAEYESALEQVKAAEASLKENRGRLEELQESIPEQQARSDAAARELYKIEQLGGGIVEMLLGSESFSDFLTKLEYVSRASEANVVEINRLNDMQTELEETQSALKQAKRDADTHAQEASDALAAAKEARQEAQRRAQEEAQRQAEEAARAAAAAEAEAKAAAEAAQEETQTADTADPENEQVDEADATEDAEQAEETGAEEADTAEQTATAATPTNDGADWTSDQAAFVEEWAGRIDAYLAGSPLAGQGATFASAAWSYGVDPRWSPAISYVESSKGAVCFASHNAWGWGSESWSSWEEAIDAHVRGLARGYGYTISIEAAQKYCPPNWQHWYDSTLEQMNLI